MTYHHYSRGYTLIELIVSVGLFALVMTLSSGAYFMMINVNRQAQATTAGIDNIAFAIEKMARSIRTGSSYGCNGAAADCTGGGTSFSFTNAAGQTVSFSRNAGAIEETINSSTRSITDPEVTITNLTFYLSGRSSADTYQPRVTIVVGGTVPSGPGKTQAFLVETAATMRGVDI